MRKTRMSLALAGLVLFGAVGCGGDELPPPEGFTLSVVFRAIDPQVITNLNVNLVPQGMDENFMALVMPLTFDENGVPSEDGPFTYDVAMDGALEIDVAGNYVADRSMDNGDGSSTFQMQMYSAILECNENGEDCQVEQESRARNPAPLLTVIVDRSGEALGDEQLFLTQWPLPVGGSASIEVSCRAGAVGRCTN